MMAMLSYRAPASVDERFSRSVMKGRGPHITLTTSHDDFYNQSPTAAVDDAASGFHAALGRDGMKKPSSHADLGKAVQVDPIKPRLKPHGTKRLKLNCDILLSTFAFQVQLGPLHLGTVSHSNEDVNSLPYFAVESYLQYQGKKFILRFDANCYIQLTYTLDSHDVARDRGEYADVLRRLTHRTLVVGRDLHSSTFRLKSSAFCGIWVHLGVV
jgi:homoserine acetyltransferase